ncbi:MAG: exosortase [Euryarchaeota archaeon]|nr:exosortase [Euryarchaeota archaeon]|tara:strand:+ start:1125 stop:2138 length:1014 start_codon:yes stop_codon:yes gene_type:complete
MDIEYRRIIGGNFGDDMNSWFWEKLSSGGWNETENTLLGIGSLLGRDRDAHKTWHVIGSGAGYRYPLDLSSSRHWNFLAVRGPLTALALGLSEDKGCTDTAILLALLPEFNPLPEDEREGIIFIPHHRAAETCEWDTVCGNAGIKYIDPRNESLEVIQTIRKAKLVLSGAMHAAIIADTFRVKWLPITTSSTINHFKWLDWTTSMNVPYNPIFTGPGSLEGKIQHIVYRYSWASETIPTDSKKAIKYLKKRNRSDPFQKFRAAAIWKIGSFIQRSLQFKIFSKIRNRINNKAMKEASTKLREASKSEGMLSEDDVFQDRLAKMENHLNSIITIKTNE